MIHLFLSFGALTVLRIHYHRYEMVL